MNPEEGKIVVFVTLGLIIGSHGTSLPQGDGLLNSKSTNETHNQGPCQDCVFRFNNKSYDACTWDYSNVAWCSTQSVHIGGAKRTCGDGCRGAI